MGNGKKAGLASMETLDDSTKDPWNTESDAVDASKSTADKPTDEKVDEVTEKGPTFWDSIRAYSCSLGESVVMSSCKCLHVFHLSSSIFRVSCYQTNIDELFVIFFRWHCFIPWIVCLSDSRGFDSDVYFPRQFKTIESGGM